MKYLIPILVIFFTTISFPQNNNPIDKRKILKNINSQEVKQIKFLPSNKKIQVINSNRSSSVDFLIDTLSYFCMDGISNFGIFGQDWLLQWFKAPTDLTIKSVGVYCMGNDNNTPAELKIVRFNWDETKLLSQPTKHQGYYPSNGSISGVTAFLDNPDRTGSWFAIDTAETEPIEHDIWSDIGVGYQFIPDPYLNEYQWINMSILGIEPTIPCGEIFGIAVKNSSMNLDSDRIGFLVTGCGNPDMWKFYANGRLIPGVDKGWWTRQGYTFDVKVVVDLSNVEYLVDIIHTPLSSTNSTDPREVNAEIIPWYNLNGELVAKVNYSTDSGNSWSVSEMEFLGNNQYRGIIPGFPSYTEIQYYIETIDTTLSCNNYNLSLTYTYVIFGPSGANTLVILNGYNSAEGYPQDYFFGPDIQSGNFAFAHDTWVQGQPPSDLFDNYTNIIEICNGAPEYYLDSLIRPWLAGGSNRNYYLEGQEWLGSRYAYIDTSFIPGNFEFDILGINHVYNDVSYANSTGQNIPSKLLPQQTTLFGQPLLDKFATYTPAPDSIQYNPVYEGNTGDQNWIDGFNVESDVVVDVMTETRGITGVPNVQNLPCAIHRTLPNGNKVFFASYWTYAVNTAVNQNLPTYHWLGNTNESCGYQALLWFGITITDVEKVGNEIPKDFSLSQNYPNPFNPSTTINYQLPTKSNVSLKVYDILGSEVATLVNQEQNAGTYNLEFNGSHLSSGVYFYQLKAGDFIQGKKMVLIK